MPNTKRIDPKCTKCFCYLPKLEEKWFKKTADVMQKYGYIYQKKLCANCNAVEYIISRRRSGTPLTKEEAACLPNATRFNDCDVEELHAAEWLLDEMRRMEAEVCVPEILSRWDGTRQMDPH